MWDFYKNGDVGKRWDSVKGGGMSNFFAVLSTVLINTAII